MADDNSQGGAESLVWTRRLGIALLSAALCQWVQVTFWSAEPLQGSFLWGHALVVLVAQVLIALLLSWADTRLWAAAVFLVPVAGSLAVASLSRQFSPLAWKGLVFASAVGAAGIWWAKGSRRVSPVAAAAAGALLGAEVCRLRVDAWRGFATPPGDLLRGAAVALIAVALMVLARRLPRAWRWPTATTSLAASVVFLALAQVMGLGGWRAPAIKPPASMPASPTTPPVVLIVLDTVRADHLKAYGYARDTMPRLERFAREEGVLVRRATSNYPASLETHASIFTGLFPGNHGAHRFLRRHWSQPWSRLGLYPLPTGLSTLAERLRERGYWTVGLSGNCGPLVPAFGLDRGFTWYDARPNDLRRRSPWGVLTTTATDAGVFARSSILARSEFFSPLTYRRAGAVTKEALAAIDAAAERPFFLFLNYFDAHEPYYPLFANRDRFPGRRWDLDPLGLSVATKREVQEGARDLTTEESAHLNALYDAQLASIDAELARVLERLKRHPRWSEMTVIITADHGEALGEHRLLGHVVSVYDEMLHVPLVVKEPSTALTAGVDPHSLQDRHVQSVDLFPMLLRAGGVEPPQGIDGVAWGRTGGPAFAWAFADRMSARQKPTRFDQHLRSVEKDGWKLIQAEKHEFELYDLAQDPNELHNQASARPELVSALQALWTTPLEPAEKDRTLSEASPEILERLRSLGYVQ
jgi:arylsulfatase A-like enzyme